MIVDVQLTIDGSRAAIWAAITDIENAPKFISGIQGIEIVERPASGLVGLRWRETRVLFGKPATVEKRIIEATENQFYRTRAESDGFVFLTTKSISETGGAIALTESHEFKPQGFVAKLQIPMLFLFRGVAKKAILQDLKDFKAAVEKG